jgi:hypothetical protein
MRRWRLALLAAGVLAMGYAVVGAAVQLGGKVGGILLFLVAVLVAHDGLWLPLVLLAGTALNRLVPARHRGTVRVAAIVAAALGMAALPLALGLGRTADNPSALPLDYGRNLALVLAGIAVVSGVTTAVRAWSTRKNSERNHRRNSR